MAKFKVKTIVHNGEWTNLDFDSGEKASVNNSKEARIKSVNPGDEIEGELKEWKNKKGEISIFFNYPKEGGGSGKFPQKDWPFEKKKAALDAAIQSVKLVEQKVTSLNIVALAETYFLYLNTK